MDTEDYAKAEDGAVDGDTCGEKAAQYIRDREENLRNESLSEPVDAVDGVEVKVIPNDGVMNGKQMNGVAENGETSGGSEGSEEEENGKKKKKKEKVEMVSYGELFKYADRKDVILMLVGAFFALINGMLQPVSFIVFGELINKFIIDASQQNTLVNGTRIAKTIDIEDEMTTFAAYYCYIALGMLTSAYFQTAFWSLAAIRQAHRMRLSFFGSVMRQEIGWFDTTDSGELSTRLVDDVTKVQNGIGDKIGLSIQSTTMFFGGFIIGFVYGWKLTLVILALTPALLVTAGITGKVIGSFTSQEQTAYAKAGSVAEEVLGSIRTVVAFGGEEKELDRYTSHLDAAERAGVKKGATTGVAFGLFHIVIFSCYALAFWYGSTLVASGELEGGELLIVFFCVMIGAAQMGQAGPNFEALANARGAALQVIRIIDRKSQIDPVSNEGRKPDYMIGDVDFLKVHFEYPSRPDIKILNGLSLSIKSGQTVALVGESGCGKSTTIKLVQRFYDTIQGAVTIDGIDIRDLNVAWLRGHIGVVSQEPLLFDMTISDNIRMGNPNASQADIERAAKDANAHNFIMGLPKKFDTNVGEGGAQLSGGQKQRIAIARALVKDPKILLLDEATSALDTESESIVQSALDRASEGRTTIIIAHRLSTVKKADMIAAVQDGRVVEVGTHEELMEKRGVYFQLVMLQTAVEEEEEESDAASILSEEEREQKLALKYMRTLSTLSTGSENEKEVAKQIEMVLHRRLSRKSSALSRPRSAKTPDKKSKKKKEEEKEEEENIEIPPITRIFKLNAKEWPYLLIGSFFASIVGAFPVVFAIILSEILESFSFTDTNKLKEEARFWSLIFLVLGFADAIGLFVSSFLFAKAGEVLTKRLRHFAFKAMLRQDIGYHDDPLNSTGALTARLASDTSGVQGATSSRLSTMVQVVVMGLTAIILAFVYQWKLTLLILAFVPFLAFGGAMQTKMSTSFAAEEKQKMVDAGALATEAIINVRTVASLGREDYFVNKYKDLLYVTYRKSKIRAQVYGLSFGSSMAVMMFANAASFRLGGYLVARDEVKFDDMFKVVLAIVFGAMIAGQIASFAPDYVKAKISAARLFRLFDTVPRIDSYSEEGTKLDHIEGTVEFRDVKFAYPSRPDVQVLKGFNVCIRPGQTLALVGASGCGKSTSVGLLERFYNVAEGIVLIDGHDIKSLNIKWLRSQLGIVSQEPVLFDCTIADNIRYGVNSNERQVTQSEIEEAAKSANIHHFISSLPKGYNTMVGDKGTLISGGQKQRIAIARALLRNPRILLLDEATSALDSESEKVVQDALDVAMEGRTAIIIAHRLSTIQNADVIAVIQGGQVVEQGTHAELIAKKGAYYLLNEAQI